MQSDEGQALGCSTERTVRCAHESCQRVIYPGRYRQRRYCSEACKQAAYRKRQKRVTPP